MSATRPVRVVIGGVEHVLTTAEARDVRERIAKALRVADEELRKAAPCAILEYDGSYSCITHKRSWGAITHADEPCAGWRP